MNETHAKIAGAFVAALLLNLGVDTFTDRKDVAQPTFDHLEDRQHDDALANCEAIENLKDDIRETLLVYVPERDRRQALARFVERDCDEEITERSD